MLQPQYPLVSCLMPTYNRREFIPRALRCFAAQTYPNLELVIADNGSDQIDDLLTQGKPIHHVRVDWAKLNHGQLMNQACEFAKGEFCIVWDDDDFYAPDRVLRQIVPLVVTNIDYAISGLKNLYYYDKAKQQAWRYNDPSDTWLGAIAFRKSAWEAKRFIETPSGCDLQFQRDHKGKVIAVQGDAIACAVHATNAGGVRNSVRVPGYFTAIEYAEVVAFTGGDL